MAAAEARDAYDILVEEQEAAELQRLDALYGSHSDEDNKIWIESRGLTNKSTVEDDGRITIRRQQQRLLLLRHAARCSHEDDRCPVTSHCPAMKRLWRHIAECKNNYCTIAHCVSSRYILSHYRQCADDKCPVCAPVRDAIRRNHLRAKELAAKTNAVQHSI